MKFMENHLSFLTIEVAAIQKQLQGRATNSTGWRNGLQSRAR
jgi:hypothetical protein